MGVIRKVRTPEGSRKYGQPIGSIIVTDGAPPLKGLKHSADLDGDWSRVRGSNGRQYDVGHDKTKNVWVATAKDDPQRIVVDDAKDETELLQKLDAMVLQKRSGSADGERPKYKPGSRFEDLTKLRSDELRERTKAARLASIKGDDEEKKYGERDLKRLLAERDRRKNEATQENEQQKQPKDLESLDVRELQMEKRRAMRDGDEGLVTQIQKIQDRRHQEERDAADRRAELARDAEPPVPSVAEDASYKMQHTAPHDDGYSKPLSALDEMFPDDVYTKPQNYSVTLGPGGAGTRRETVAAMQKAKGNPEALVRVYRALPPAYSEINAGDWVTLERAYAEQHAISNGEEDWPIVAMDVPAKHVFNDGNDLAEFGYDGPRLTGLTQYRKGESMPAPDTMTVENHQKAQEARTEAVRAKAIRLALDQPPGALELTRENVKHLQDTLRAAYPEAEIDLSGSGYGREPHMKLSLIRMPKESRGLGTGSKMMAEIAEFADRNGWPVALTPDGSMGTSKAKLTAWYQSNGFVPNKGRNKDFTVSDTMIRQPQIRNEIRPPKDFDPDTFPVHWDETGLINAEPGMSYEDTSIYSFTDPTGTYTIDIEPTQPFYTRRNGETVRIQAYEISFNGVKWKSSSIFGGKKPNVQKATFQEAAAAATRVMRAGLKGNIDSAKEKREKAEREERDVTGLYDYVSVPDRTGSEAERRAAITARAQALSTEVQDTIQRSRDTKVATRALENIVATLEGYETMYPGVSKYLTRVGVDTNIKKNGTVAYLRTTDSRATRMTDSNARRTDWTETQMQFQTGVTVAKDDATWDKKMDEHIKSNGAYQYGNGFYSIEDLDEAAAYWEVDKKDFALQYTLNHELGHMVSQVASGMLGEDTPEQIEARKTFNERSTEIMVKHGLIGEGGKFIQSHFMDALKSPAWLRGPVVDQKVSRYAATNIHELFAETWVGYMLDPEPTAFVKEYGAMMEEVLMERLNKENSP